MWVQIPNFLVLSRGDLVRSKHNHSRRLIVSGVFGIDRATAIVSADLTNPAEWEVFCKDDSQPSTSDLQALHLFVKLVTEGGEVNEALRDFGKSLLPECLR